MLAKLQHLSFPILTPEDTIAIETPISILETEKAITSFPPGKIPGPDGLPGDWYKMYVKRLAPELQNLYLGCFNIASLSPTMYQAHIVLIPKPGKNPLFCSSYRPISLLNYDQELRP